MTSHDPGLKEAFLERVNVLTVEEWMHGAQLWKSDKEHLFKQREQHFVMD